MMGDDEINNVQRRLGEVGMKMLEQIRPMIDTIVGVRQQLIDGGFTEEDASRIAAEIIIDGMRAAAGKRR